MPHRSVRPALASGFALCLLLTGCGAGSDDRASGSAISQTQDSDDHGEMEGAAEVSEAPVGLTTVDPQGVVRHLDLADESVEVLAEAGPVDDAATDGRYVFLQQDDGVEVIDSGVWTWDHVDHQHFYRGEPEVIGTVEGGGPVKVASSEAPHVGSTGLFFPTTGEAVLLDNAALADGEIRERFRVETVPHEGIVAPVGEHALMTSPEPSGRGGRADRVVVLDAEGEQLPGAAYDCPKAAGTITTRVGTVVGCADGALLATSGDAGPEMERIPYPEDVQAPAAADFRGRKGRPTVAGLADQDRIWMLDTRERSWQLLDAPAPLDSVVAVDDSDEHVLGLTAEGEVAVIDGASGELLATTPPLAAESAGRRTLVVDQQRAYLNAPQERRLVEIDFADGGRVSRTFDTESQPLYVAGTGR